AVQVSTPARALSKP
ncbi:hypothetical protein, partial [Mycobacterium tuberculosis]